MVSTVIETQHIIKFGHDFVTISYQISASLIQVYVNSELVVNSSLKKYPVQISYLNVIEVASTIYQKWLSQEREKAIQQINSLYEK